MSNVELEHIRGIRYSGDIVGLNIVKICDRSLLGGCKRSLVATDGLHRGDAYSLRVLEGRLSFQLTHVFGLLQPRVFQ